LKLPNILLALLFLPIYKQPFETKMGDSSSVSDTESASTPLSSTIPAALIQSLAVLPANEALRNSNEPPNNLYRNPYVNQAVLTTVCEIHRTARDRLNLVPEFSQQQHIRLDEFQAAPSGRFDSGPEASEALLAVKGLLDRVEVSMQISKSS
jgi:hypothetical protein